MYELDDVQISQNKLSRSKRGNTGTYVLSGVIAASCISAYVACGAATAGVGFFACYVPYLGCIAGAYSAAQV
jgi:hypothetical protein